MSGRVYLDNNANYIFDSGDVPVVNGSVYVYNQDSSFFSFITTGANGIYSRDIPAGNCEIGGGTEDRTRYTSSPSVKKTYSVGVSDTVDFACQKRKDVESVEVHIYNEQDFIDNHYQLLPNDSSKSYKVLYRFTGYRDTINAKLIIDFNPQVSLLSSGISPTNTIPGHIEWSLSNIVRNNEMSFSLKFQEVGDTIGAFMIKAALLVEGYGNPDPLTNTMVYTQYIDHTDKSKAVSQTKGIKWLRTFADASGKPPYSVTSIDTSADGESFFYTGLRGVYQPVYNTVKNHEAVLGKLSKEGLSIWEKPIESIFPDGESYSMSKVKHTKDGGCIGIGYINYWGYWQLKNLLVVKFSSTGQVEWNRRMSEVDFIDEGCDISEIASGYLVTACKRGRASNHSDLDSTKKKVYVGRLSTQGNLLWEKLYGGSRDDKAVRIVPLKNGSAMIFGTTQSGNGDVKGAHTHRVENFGGSDTIYAAEAWLFNIDINGNILWSKCFGGSANSIITGFAETDSSFLLAGNTDSKDGDLSAYDEATVPLWLLGVSKAGEIRWTREYKSYRSYSDTEYLEGNYKPKDWLEGYYRGEGARTGLHKTPDGNYVIGLNSMDRYGEIYSFHYLNDMIIAKVSPNGDLLWQKAIGGNDVDILNDIIVDGSGDIVFAGQTASVNDDLYQPMKGATGLMLIGTIGPKYSISGRLFLDSNANGIQDGNEQLVDEGKIKIFKAGDSTLTSVQKGQFLSNLDSGTYTIEWFPIRDYYTVTQNLKTVSLSRLNPVDSVHFALVPKPGIHDLEISIMALTPPTPGVDAKYRIITKNVGTEPVPNVVVSLLKSSKFSLTSASRLSSLVGTDSLNFQPVSLSIGGEDTLDITCKLAASPQLIVGDTLVFKAIAKLEATDTTPGNNSATLKQIVLGSYDPSNKTESHAGIYTSAMQATQEPLQYLIRFKNTGTDTAYYLTVKDTLDGRLDISSLKTISASHPYRLSIKNGIATWQLDLIKLGNSATNQGYILFSIQPKSALKAPDTIQNRAAIYFDFNLPVITKEVLVKYETEGCPIVNTWTGVESSDWEFAGNWGCGTVPDSKTNVFIGAEAPRQPEVNTNSAFCKSIEVQNGAHVWIKQGAKLNIGCNPFEVDLSQWTGNYTRTFDTWVNGTYTTTISNIVSTGPTSAQIQVSNFYNKGWGPITFNLDWSNPDNKTAIVVAQNPIPGSNAGDLSPNYAGLPVVVRPYQNQPGKIKNCDEPLVLNMQLGVGDGSGGVLGYFGTLYQVKLAR